MQRTQGFRLLKRLLAAGLASLLVLSGAVTAQAASGSVSGIDVNINYRTNPDGSLVEGEQHTINLYYATAPTAGFDEVLEPGTVFTIELPAGVDVADAELTKALEKNQLVETLDRNGNKITIVFKDSFKGLEAITNGAINFKFSVENVEVSEEVVHHWQINGEETEYTVVLKEPGDEFIDEIISDSAKTGPNALDLTSVVSYNKETGEYTLNRDALARQEINYTLILDTPNALTNVRIEDTVDNRLVYVPGSLKITQTSWDAQGRNKKTVAVPTPDDIEESTTGFGFNLSVPLNSKTKITYSAKISEAQVDALWSELRTQIAAASPGAKVKVTVDNTAVIGGRAHEKSVDLTYTVPAASPDPGPVAPTGMFNKTSNLNRALTARNEDGTLAQPLDITYTLTADLTKYAAADDKFKPTQNVVIVDTLPEGVQWQTGTEFIAVTGSGPITELQPVAGLTDVTANSFADNSYVGKYFVDGKNLYINVGRDYTTKVQIAAKAQILATIGSGSVPDATFPELADRYWKVVNTADFHTGLNSTKKQTTSYPYTARDRDPEGEDNEKYFAKGMHSQDITVNPGASTSEKVVYNVPVTFTVDGVQLHDARIVDYIDHSFFNVTAQNVSDIKITGTYDGTAVTEENFTVGLDDARNLVITPNAENWPHDTSNKKLKIEIVLQTLPLDPRRTAEVTNRATIFGQDNEILYRSETTARASNAGSEAEVRKSVENGRGGWGDNLILKYDTDGNLLDADGTICDSDDTAQDCGTFMYKIEVIGHDGYSGPVAQVSDKLPAELEFLSFANADGFVLDGDTVDADNGLQARVDRENSTVFIEYKPGVTRFAEGVPGDGERVSAVIFKVRIKADADIKMNTPIWNVALAGDKPVSEVPVTPSADYPLFMNKVDGDDASTVISDANARFTIVGPLPSTDVITESAYVLNGEIVIDVDGEPTAVTVADHGFYNVTEVVAPKGYQLPSKVFEVYVPETGMAQPAVLQNFKEPTPDPEKPVPTPDPEKPTPTPDPEEPFVEVDSDSKDGSDTEKPVVEVDSDSEETADSEVLSQTGTNAGHLALGALITVLLGALFLGLARRRPREG
ncbi:hypothetical protein ACFSYH_09185 [Populibacterium corticicola]|uniref:Isopeptide-forming domain-containing fimbrial protein n=1 Tax=Populibacterium corticicola TaxID=1812826 RepID=A0ABW5XI37_9MICO